MVYEYAMHMETSTLNKNGLARDIILNIKQTLNEIAENIIITIVCMSASL
jgi:hypothetical protein